MSAPAYSTLAPTATLVVAHALPDDPALDAFASGDVEVDRYFHSRQWFNTARKQASPPTFALRAPEGALVGLVTVGFRRAPWPTDTSWQARTLTVYAIGVDRAYQGQRNPLAPEETYAASVMAVVERMAREKVDCLGLALWVREANARAISFYRRCGFVGDPGGAVQRDDKAPHWTMRKAFDRG